MEIKRVPISEVEVWEKNPRNIKTKDFERLKKQIQELGVYKPLICIRENGKYITLGGNMRLRALTALNLKEVDISLVEAKDEATKIKYALSDNDRVGIYEEEKLAELVYPYIEEINLEDYRIDVGEPISLKDVIEDYGPNLDGREDEVPDIDDSPAITKMGDLFQLGKHRLLCGDATKEEDVKRLMGGEKADMVFTDPPYGINAVSHNKVGITGGGTIGGEGIGIIKANIYQKIEGDDKPFNPLPYLKLASKVLLFGANNYASKLPDNSHWIVWDKKCEKGADRNFFSDAELIWTNIERKSCPIYRHLWSGLLREGNRDEELLKRIHPTQKPVGLIKNILKDYSREKEIIADLFLGSGTTLIACEKLNRICYGMEIEPKYCDVVITRFSNFTDIPKEEIRATRQ